MPPTNPPDTPSPAHLVTPSPAHSRDALIIGAGLAGSSLAAALAQRGWDVLLVERDRLPRHKVCGEFLSPEAQHSLARLGLLDAVAALNPVPLHGAALWTPGGRCIEMALPAPAWGLSRHSLDAALAAAAGYGGAEFWPETTVIGAAREGEGVAVQVRGAAARTAARDEREPLTLHARTVIFACGRHSAAALPPRDSRRPPSNRAGSVSDRASLPDGRGSDRAGSVSDRAPLPDGRGSDRAGSVSDRSSLPDGRGSDRAGSVSDRAPLPDGRGSDRAGSVSDRASLPDGRGSDRAGSVSDRASLPDGRGSDRAGSVSDRASLPDGRGSDRAGSVSDRPSLPDGRGSDRAGSVSDRAPLPDGRGSDRAGSVSDRSPLPDGRGSDRAGSVSDRSALPDGRGSDRAGSVSDRAAAGKAPHDWRHCAGLKRHYTGVTMPPRVELYLFPGGYVGINPVEGAPGEGRANVCVLLTYAAFQSLGKSLDCVLEAAAARHPALAQRLAGAQPVAGSDCAVAPVNTERRPAPWDSLLDAPCLGDTAAMIPPLAGDGMAMALRSAELCLEGAHGYLAGQLSREGWAQAYTRAWRAEFAGRLRLGKALQRGLTTPHLGDGLAAVGGTFPALAQWMLAGTRGRMA